MLVQELLGHLAADVGVLDDQRLQARRIRNFGRKAATHIHIGDLPGNAGAVRQCCPHQYNRTHNRANAVNAPRCVDSEATCGERTKMLSNFL